MTSKLKEIEKNALRLSPKDRAELAEHLIHSLDEVEDGEAERIWIEEAERRYKEYKEGKVEGIPAELVFKEARLKLK